VPDLSSGVVLFGAAVAALAVAVAILPPGVSQRTLLIRGGVALVAMAAIVAAGSLDLVILILLATAMLHAGLSTQQDFAKRLRGPVWAAAVLALALIFARAQGPDMLSKLSAVGLAAGLAAGVGLLPFIHEPAPGERIEQSPAVWMGFVGPVLAAAVVLRSRELLPPDAGAAFGGMLIGLGLLNLLWGTAAAWWTTGDRAAWHYSFMSDWGLALCGFGITIADGQAAALLLLFGVVLGRFPVLLASAGPGQENGPSNRPLNLAAAAMLAGSAPFAGFAARLLLLRGATEIYWPLALALAIGMLLWLPASLRLGRSLGRPKRRQVVALVVVLAVNAAVGIYPLPLLSLAGL
jgi:hypothetical protein